MQQKSDKISDMELEIMKIIWQNDAPMTFSEIRKELGKNFDWGSQVINTMIKRLVQKKVLEQQKKEVYYYHPLITEDQYLKAKTLSFLQKVYGGNGKGLLSALISYEEVTPKDLDELKDFWQKERKDHE